VYIARRRYALTSAYSDDDIDAIASDREEEEIEEEKGEEEGEGESGGERDERGVRPPEGRNRVLQPLPPQSPQLAPTMEHGEHGEHAACPPTMEHALSFTERETRNTRVRKGSAHSSPPHACPPLSPLSSISSVPPGPDVGDGGGHGSRSGSGGGGGGFEFAQGGGLGWGLGARVWVGEGVRGTKAGQMRLQRQV